ncbi:hypothetical protein BDF20DRAFT_897682 [Mycotypha africana]|uniref:uncharacterized protein n=1 Tax=Mycotypha africana TaxID=64632 RepID=UPI0023008083|nr:uncharacterized protein BDF20DRAFT_897682 [Mycotypha africana]KAI8967893.1 hypothetical protein BDF20DRAFT_897682 [Mycotypha africana]
MNLILTESAALSTSARLSFIPISTFLLYFFSKYTNALALFNNSWLQSLFIGFMYICTIGSVVLLANLWKDIKIACQFMYSCFLKKLGDCGNSPQDRLEAFYQDQALIYDESREALLKGRKTMLKLCAAQLKEQISTGTMNKRPIWVDLGGGTGWNIETMHSMFSIDEFEKVILVDLTPSLCEVARKRFSKRGWKNVIVVCQDASTFEMPGCENVLDGQVGLVTLSYSLSMMDHFYPIVDRIQSLLLPEGLLGVVDFYVSGRSKAPATHWFPQLGRQCNWFTRHFWQGWFELDHIHLEPGRRDYLEYKFASIKSLNYRNHFIIPFLIQIPYYIWLGRSHAQQQNGSCRLSELADDSDSVTSEQSNQTLVNGSQNSNNTVMCKQSLSRPQLSFQNKAWRIDYDPELSCNKQFRSYIYAFTWEDPRVDLQYLNLSKDDTLFLITSAGDNALEYAIHSQPKRIHCVDMNPCQNHLLELKLAAISSLDFSDFWKMFGEGCHSQFSRLLHDKLSPHLSSYAYAYWNEHSNKFNRKFYKTGYSGLALTIVEWWIRIKGIRDDIDKLINSTNNKEQADIWMQRIRPHIFTTFIQKIINNPIFMWNALGVPINQMKMFLKECTAQEYIESTLDPILQSTSLKTDNYFYYLCLNQRYNQDCCPSYLTETGFKTLKTSGALDAFRLHTSSILSALKTLPENYLTQIVVMDHMDWFNPESCIELDQEISEMMRVLQNNGKVYWRSASTQPWYNETFVKHGFVNIEPLNVRKPGQCIDRVNMYASFYRATKP